MRAIPCALMRGGTSKGVYLLADDLPRTRAARAKTLLALLGSPDPRQIDGLGGGDMLTSKVAIVSRAPAAEKADLLYRFAQVYPDRALVDENPTCGNILAGVGAFAILRGLIAPSRGKTRTLVRDINTGALIEQIVPTPGGRLSFAGKVKIAGAPNPAAGIALNFMEIAGAKTGRLFPTGNRADDFGGVRATCIDAAMPLVVAAAAALKRSGYETRDELQRDADLFSRLEKIRLAASRKMGLGDARGKVIPKIALVAAPRAGGHIASRYFTPTSAHAAYAVSGGCALAAAALIDGTIARDFAAGLPPARKVETREVAIEHPAGKMAVRARMEKDGGGDFFPAKAGVVRTARLLMDGIAYLP